MRKISMIFLFGLMEVACVAQGLNLEWVISNGGLDRDEGFSVVANDSGHVYTTGTFKGSVDFDPGPTSYSLASKGEYDIYVQKLDNQGNFLWARSFGGKSTDFSTSITLDTIGDIYVTGAYRDTVDFDPSTPAFEFISSGYTDVFVLKLNDKGQVKWVKSVGGSGSDWGTSITAKGVDNIYVIGKFIDSLILNPGSSYPSYLTSNSSGDPFVIKYDGGGSLTWARSWGGPQTEDARSIVTDGRGNIYITGSFSATADFNPDTTVYGLSSKGSGDVYVLKLTSGGLFIWAKSFGGSLNDHGSSLVVDESGNSYTTGIFKGTADFDPGPSTINLSSIGEYDFFIQKLDANGVFLWAKSIGGSFNDNCYSISSDSTGSLYLTGYYNNKVDFDPDTATFNLTSKGASDIFILKLDSTGQFKWVKSMGGANNDWGNAIGTDKLGNVFVTGGFNNTADFLHGPGTYNLTSNGWWDAYVLKLNVCGMIFGTDVVTACKSYTWKNGITYTLSNNTAKDTLINTKGCDSIVTLDLTINNADVSLSISDPNITANAVGANYQWLDCNSNMLLVGDTFKLYTASLNGRYAVVVTQNGCSDTSDCIEISTIGLDEIALFNNFTIYPNPSTGHLVLEMEKSDDYEISVVSANGNRVYSIHVKNKSSIELVLPESLSNGLHVVVVKNGNDLHKRKFILNR